MRRAYPPICRKAYGKKVNVRDFIIGKPLNIAHGGKNRRFVGKFFPQISTIRSAFAREL